MTISEKNVIIDSVKLAEDGSGDLIIRLYECQNSYTDAKVSFGFDVKSVCVTNNKRLYGTSYGLRVKQITS